MILFDVAPFSTGVGLGVALVFFLVFAAVAFIAYKMLKKTVKMAVRMIIVAIILLIATVGGISLFYFSGSNGRNGGVKPPTQIRK
jgi:hypothetical protein